MTTTTISPNNRKDNRHLIHDRLQVFRQDTGELLGNLADVSIRGVKLISLEPIETGKYFKLNLPLPGDLLAEAQIQFEAKSIWSGRGRPPNTYATGFHTNTISEKNLGILTSLLEKTKETGGYLSD